MIHTAKKLFNNLKAEITELQRYPLVSLTISAAGLMPDGIRKRKIQS